MTLHSQRNRRPERPPMGRRAQVLWIGGAIVVIVGALIFALASGLSLI